MVKEPVMYDYIGCFYPEGGKLICKHLKKVGKLVTFVAIIILLVVAILSPYNLFKKIYFIIGVLIIGAISLGANKFFELIHSKFNKK